MDDYKKCTCDNAVFRILIDDNVVLFECTNCGKCEIASAEFVNDMDDVED